MIRRWDFDNDTPKEAPKTTPYTVPPNWKAPSLKELYLYVRHNFLTIELVPPFLSA